MKFSELPLHEQVLQGTEAAHFEECMPVQEKVLPVSIDGYDVMVSLKLEVVKQRSTLLLFLRDFSDCKKRDMLLPA